MSEKELINDEKIKLEGVKPDKSLRILTGDRPTRKNAYRSLLWVFKKQSSTSR